MTQKDKLRESFLALVSIKSTANNIIDYCSEYSSEAANYAQEIKHKCEQKLRLVIKTKIKKENIEIENSQVIILDSFITTNYINMFHTNYGE